MLKKFVKLFGGDPNKREIEKFNPIIESVNALEEEFERLNRDELRQSETLEVSLSVSNTGTRPGEEVVQLYVSAIGSAVERAPKELKAFTRVALEPGETKIARLSVPISCLAYYDGARAEFVVEPLQYEVFVGAHSLDPNALRGRFAVCF